MPHTINDWQRPESTDDYPVVEGTAVHWRPGETTHGGQQLNDGDTAPVGSVIPDVAGTSDMTRAPLRGGAVQDDVTYTADVHPLSSDKGSLTWSKPISALDVNFFETATGADINSENFPGGHTLEAFLKIDEDFDGDSHGWGNALIREDRVVDADPENNDSDPAQMLGVSNLREIRWWSYGDNHEGHSNWSHEVPKGEWLHIAIVNDVEKDMVEMYIDGAPILRDGSGPIGLASESKWLMGTSASDGKLLKSWFGSIGEVRIVDHAIGPDQWLTSRSPEDTGTDPDTTTDPDTAEGPSSSDGSSGMSSTGSSRFAAGTALGVALGIIASIVAVVRFGPAAVTTLKDLWEKFRP